MTLCGLLGAQLAQTLIGRQHSPLILAALLHRRITASGRLG